MRDQNAELERDMQKPLQLTEEEKVLFDQEQGQKILDEYVEADRRAHLVRNERAYNVPALAHVMAPQEPIREPALGWKKRREKRKRLSKDLKKGKKLTQDATCYTSPILEYETKHQNEGPDDEPGQDANEALAELKQNVLKKKYNANKFDKDYLGEHYAEVRGEMKELKLFLDFYGTQGAKHGELLPAEQARAKVLEDVYRAMETALSGSIAMHCVKKTDSGYSVKAGAPDEATIHSYQEGVTGLKEKIQSLDEKEVEETYKKLFEGRRGETENMQKENLEKYPLVKEKFGEIRLFSPYSYSGINDLLMLINKEENKDLYAANKDVVEKMLSDIKKIGQVNCDHSMELWGWNTAATAFRNAGADEDDPRIYMAENRMSVIEWRQMAYEERFRELVTILTLMFKGSMDKMNQSKWKLLAGYDHEEAKEKAKERSDDANLYVHTIEEKERLYREACEKACAGFEQKEKMVKMLTTGSLANAAMLMKTGDMAYNEKVVAFQVKKTMDPASVAKDGEELLSPMVTAIIDYRLNTYVKSEGDDLIAQQKEVQNLIIAGRMINDLSHQPSDVPGLALKEKLLGKPPLTKDTDVNDDTYQVLLEKYESKAVAFEQRLKMLEGYHMQTRAAALLTEATVGLNDPLSVLTKEEREAAKQKFPDATPRDQLVLYSRSMTEEGLAAVKLARDAVITSDLIREHLRNDLDRANRHHKLADGYLDKVHTDNGDYISVRCSEKIKKKIEELKKTDPNIGNEKDLDMKISKILYKEAKEKNDPVSMREFSIYVRLHLSSFKLTGDAEPLFGEAIFRAFGSMEGLDVFREMNDESYNLMLDEMAEGAFLDETATKEEIEAAREKNKNGLRTYYNHIKVHYDMMEKKYGLDMPDVSWIMLHAEEVIRDLATTQVDGHLIQHEKEELKRSDAGDARLIHQVNYFCQLACAITGVVKPYMGMDMDSDFIMAKAKEELDKAAPDVEYLKFNPKKVKEDKKAE